MNRQFDSSERQANKKKLRFLQYPLVAAIAVGVSWLLGTAIGGYWRSGSLHLAEAILGGLVSAVVTYAITDWRNRKSGL